MPWPTSVADGQQVQASHINSITNAIQTWQGTVNASNNALANVLAMTVVAAARPEITLQAIGTTGRCHMFQATDFPRLDLSANVYFNGTSWLRDDVTETAAAVNINGSALSAFDVLTVSAAGVLAVPFSVRANGNVLLGTGTDDGANKLQISGSARFIRSNAGGVDGDFLLTLDRVYGDVGDWAGLRFGDTSANGIAAIKSVAWGGGEGALTLSAQTGSGSGVSNEVMRVQGNGNVGIGITNPQYKLSLGSNLANTKLAVYDNGAGAAYGFGVQGNQFRFHVPDSLAQFMFLNAAAGSVLFTVGGSASELGSVNVASPGHSATLNLSTAASTTHRVISMHHAGTGNMMELYNHDGVSWLGRLTLTAAGNLGLGVGSPTHQLQLSLDSAAKPTSNTWTIASDARTKTNITPFTDGLATIKQLNPVSYELNGKAGLPAGSQGVSIVAQDVLTLLPDCISTWNAKLEPDDEQETELYSFNSSNLTWRLVNAVKELAADKEELMAEVAALTARVEALESA